MNGRVFLARATGGLFTLLGTIHCAATPFVIREPGLDGLDVDAAATFTAMFLGTGLAVVCSGAAFLLAAPALGRGERWPQPMLSLTAAFLVALSLLCVCAMPSNPFAWISLAGAGLALWTALFAARPRPRPRETDLAAPSEVFP